MSHGPTPGPDGRPDDPNRGKRTTFRVLGGLVLVAGVLCCLVAIVDFFGATATDSSAEPTKFWLLFVGIPLLGVGGWLVQAGFVVAASAYLISESAPAARQARDVLGVGPRGGGRYCSQCGRQGAVDARFCDGCGASLG